MKIEYSLINGLQLILEPFLINTGYTNVNRNLYLPIRIS